MHSFCDVDAHLLSLLVGDTRHRTPLFMQQLKQGATVAELSDDDGMATVSGCSHEQHQVGVADLGEGFHFSLVLLV